MSTIIKDEEKGYQWMIVNVYSPVLHSRRRDFWDELNVSKGGMELGAWGVTRM